MKVWIATRAVCRMVAGVFLPGELIDRNAVVSGDAMTQTWGYTQLWINF